MRRRKPPPSPACEPQRGDLVRVPTGEIGIVILADHRPEVYVALGNTCIVCYWARDLKYIAIHPDHPKLRCNFRHHLTRSKKGAEDL